MVRSSTHSPTRARMVYGSGFFWPARTAATWLSLDEQRASGSFQPAELYMIGASMACGL